MKKAPLFANFVPFPRGFLRSKLCCPPSILWLRCTLILLLVFVLLFCIRIAFLKNQNDKTIGRVDRVHGNNGKQKWLKPRMECEKVFYGDRELVGRMVRSRQSMTDPDELEMSCEAIIVRHWDDPERDTFVRAKNGENMTEVERQMPMAFARAVYTDYLFLEAELVVNYAPNNWYCYVLDSKSSANFQLRMRQLASCFDNVIVMDQMFDIDGKGNNMNNAMMECARALSDVRRPWKYLMTLQNHDVQAKTNAEMAQILTWLGGANDIEVELHSANTKSRLKHYQQHFDWTFKALHLFKDEAKNRQRTDGTPLALNLSKGYMSTSLAREFVDFVVNELDVTTLLKQLNKGIFGMDEHFWQSLSTSEALDAPGGFPHKCFVKGNDPNDSSSRKYKFITRSHYWDRFAMWKEPSSKCRSGNWRHSVCVFGLEDLMGPNCELCQLPHLFVNKFMQEFDFDAVLCWHQWIRTRRRAGTVQLDGDFYRDWSQTKYQRERGLAKKMNDRTEVDCDSGMVRLSDSKRQ